MCDEKSNAAVVWTPRHKHWRDSYIATEPHGTIPNEQQHQRVQRAADERFVKRLVREETITWSGFVKEGVPEAILSADILLHNADHDGWERGEEDIVGGNEGRMVNSLRACMAIQKQHSVGRLAESRGNLVTNSTFDGTEVIGRSHVTISITTKWWQQRPRRMWQ